jgi:AhpD family alkylhydroperoxidase
MERIDYRKVGADGFKLLGAMAAYSRDCSIDYGLVELAKLRASQINGCANCVNLHVNTLRKLGETEERMHNMVVWWDADCFDKREKAALAWTEAVTLVSNAHVPDDVYERARAEFSEQELVDLTYAIITINAHNRLAIAFHRPAGS